MNYYLVCRSYGLVIEKRTSPPREEWFDVNPECLYAECYEIYEDEDGTKTALLNEKKLANIKMKIEAREVTGRRGF